MKPEDSCDNAIDEMAKDIDLAINILASEDTQYHRRNYVRALFSYLEAFSYYMRRNAEELIELKSRNGKPADPMTILLLKEEIPTIGDNGKIEIKPHKVPFKKRFSFTFRVFIEQLGINADPFSEHGWNDLRKALDIRDRLMHPKTNADVIVTDTDIEICRSATTWFKRLVVKLKNNNRPYSSIQQ